MDIPVDELLTWKQLIGDRRLSDALAECDARGWDALPLAPRQFSRLFPDLWDTEKAAERWLAKNPLEAYRDIMGETPAPACAGDCLSRRVRVDRREAARFAFAGIGNQAGRAPRLRLLGPR